MKKTLLKISPITILVLCFLGSLPIFSQSYDKSKTDEIFTQFEDGIKTGAIKEFSGDLMSETYISLENGVSSYFSANQSFYILKDYFQNFKPITFKFINTNVSNKNPFAIGQYVYSKNGIRGESQVFIALKLEGENWKISQIIIN